MTSVRDERIARMRELAKKVVVPVVRKLSPPDAA